MKNNQYNSTITPVLWSRKDKDGLYPIKIRITINRKSSYKSIGWSVKKSDWSNFKKRVKTTHKNFVEINHDIEKTLKEYDDIRMVNPKMTINKTLITDYILEIVDDKKEKGRNHTAKRYKTLYYHLKGFKGNSNIHFQDIDRDFINEFRNYLENNVNARMTGHRPSSNTIGHYLKLLKTTINKAIDNNDYFGINPFTSGMMPKKSKKDNNPLNKDELWLLNNIPPDFDGLTKWMWDSINIFLYALNSNGIRIGDALKLKYENVIDGFVKYKMGKTDQNHQFPLTPFNVIRAIPYIEGIEKQFDWDKKKFILASSFDDNDEQKRHYYKKSDDEMFWLFSRQQILRFELDELIAKTLPDLNQKIMYESRANTYFHKPIGLYSREAFKNFTKSEWPHEKEALKKYNDEYRVYMDYCFRFFIDYCKDDENKNKFIFPFLRGLENDTSEKRDNKIGSITAMINKNLKKVSKKLDIIPFTTHYARHTFATMSKDMGVDIYTLMKWLNHSSVKITEVYINSIDDSRLNDHSEKMNDYLLE
ncbi:site-specific integrase [Mesoflavibacter zeaxanthinifaciens]|uniref:site-specific integrase n=1 Tax=Mesoflavibacter zeaxanthinifaciens TaxID=393060 RepID=UPI0026F083D7|nr:site-specific integrase [Mesoflavibacter zeaxanthinifaciens]